MDYEYCYLVYDNGLPLSMAEFDSLTYRRRNKLLKWMRHQKKLEQKQRDQQQQNN